MSKIDAKTKIGVFKIEMYDHPSVIREIQIPLKYKLYEFAESIISSVGWYFDHAFGFVDDVEEPYSSKIRYELFHDMGMNDGPLETEDVVVKGVKKTNISTAFPKVGDEMLFLFDYGDDHFFHVELVDIKSPEEGTTYPVIKKVKGRSPKQY
ncbi:MAG: hypothetical protein JNK24_03610 [Alphaproteobacteria bacterium]|nr:hypothetical protein [Alphaproteobacteria bacterium]